MACSKNEPGDFCYQQQWRSDRIWNQTWLLSGTLSFQPWCAVFLSRHRQKWTEGIDDSQTTADSEFTGDFSTNANFSHQFWPLKTPNESAFIAKCSLINVCRLLQLPALLNMVGEGELNGELSTNSWYSNVTFGWTSPAQSCTHLQTSSFLCKLIKQTNLGLDCEQQRFYLSALLPESVCQ